MGAGEETKNKNKEEKKSSFETTISVLITSLQVKRHERNSIF